MADKVEADHTKLHNCELCGGLMPAKSFKRDGKDVCIYCIDIYEEV